MQENITQRGQETGPESEQSEDLQSVSSGSSIFRKLAMVGLLTAGIGGAGVTVHQMLSPPGVQRTEDWTEQEIDQLLKKDNLSLIGQAAIDANPELTPQEVRWHQYMEGWLEHARRDGGFEGDSFEDLRVYLRTDVSGMEMYTLIKQVAFYGGVEARDLLLDLLINPDEAADPLEVCKDAGIALTFLIIEDGHSLYHLTEEERAVLRSQLEDLKESENYYTSLGAEIGLRDISFGAKLERWLDRTFGSSDGW
jgi:hypothetical protein